jgi:hypothetical protein
MKRWYLIVLIVAFAVGASGWAAAATLTVTSPTLGSGNAVVASCDTDGVTFTARAIDTSVNHNVTSLTVSSINAACAGETLTVTLANTAGTTAYLTSSVALPASGFTGVATVAFSGAAPAASIGSYRVAIVGP